MTATQLLKKDHATVKKLFAEFARTTTVASSEELAELGQRMQERKRALATSTMQRAKRSVKKALRKVA